MTTTSTLSLATMTDDEIRQSVEIWMDEDATVETVTALRARWTANLAGVRADRAAGRLASSGEAQEIGALSYVALADEYLARAAR